MNIGITLLGQMIAFAVFVWFTMKFVWPPLMRAMEDRKQRIADGLAAGERGKQELQAAGERVQAELAKARERVSEIMTAAEKRNAQMLEEAKASAKAEAERIVAGARAEIEQQLARAKENLRAQVALLAVAGAEKILRREVDARTHAELLGLLQREI